MGSPLYIRSVVDHTVTTQHRTLHPRWLAVVGRWAAAKKQTLNARVNVTFNFLLRRL